MSKWQTVNEALDLILDCSPGEDENIEAGEGKTGSYSAYYWGIVQKLSLFQMLIEMVGIIGDRNEMNRSVFNTGKTHECIIYQTLKKQFFTHDILCSLSTT